MKKKAVQTRPFSYLAWAVVAMLMVSVLALISFIPSARAAPGLLQTATRDGFFSNQFPDKLIMLDHLYFYWADEYADGNGNTQDIDELNVGMGLVRLIKPWHFGDHNQYQYIIEGIVGVENLSIETGNPATEFSASGLIDPYIYTSFGWNNQKKTTHLQAALIIQFPWGDGDLHLSPGDNAYKLMPLIAIEQHFGNFWIDASMGYFYYFDDLSARDSNGRDYFELNVIPSYHIGPVSIYLQGDYKVTQESRVYGVDQNDDGYNFAVAPGVGWFFRDNMEMNLKYVIDVDGESELQGQGFNLRFLWIF